MSSLSSPPASCLFLRYHGEVINREKDHNQTRFPGKLHSACVCCSAEFKSMYFILASCVEPVYDFLVPLEEADIFLYLPLFF